MSATVDRQRETALVSANERRFAMRDLKAHLRGLPKLEGWAEAARILLAPPDEIAHVQLYVFLKAVPWVGSERIRRICQGAQVWPFRQLSQLTQAERRRVADRVLQGGGWEF